MIQERQQQTNQWALTPMQITLFCIYLLKHILQNLMFFLSSILRDQIDLHPYLGGSIINTLGTNSLTKEQLS